MVLFLVFFFRCDNRLATLERNIHQFIPILSNEKEILLLELFPFNSPSANDCFEGNDCTKVYILVIVFD